MERREENERAKYSLNVTEFEPFNGTKAIKVVTTHNLAKLLNERLKPAFADYRGCFIDMISSFPEPDNMTKDGSEHAPTRLVFLFSRRACARAAPAVSG